MIKMMKNFNQNDDQIDEKSQPEGWSNWWKISIKMNEENDEKSQPKTMNKMMKNLNKKDDKIEKNLNQKWTK